MTVRWPFLFLGLLWLGFANASEIQIEIDTSEVPHLRSWAGQAKKIAVEWYPQMSNRLRSDGFAPPAEVVLFFKKSEEGVAYASGNKITVMSSWIEKKPDDFGLIVHELTHVIQGYPAGKGPGWITEGIADYIRWAWYEDKPQEWFPRPIHARQDGYEKSYRIAAGFFLWLETEKSKGLVLRLNKLMRSGQYHAAFFQKETGVSLSKLWDEYFAMGR